MRIYDGSPRQNWEEVLRSVGAFADQEKLKDLLFLELEGGSCSRASASRAAAPTPTASARPPADLRARNDQIAEMMDSMEERRGTRVRRRPARPTP